MNVPGLDDHLDWDEIIVFDEDDSVEDLGELAELLDDQYVTGSGRVIPDYYEYWPEDGDDD